MRKNLFRETRIQGIWLSISGNRCSITRWTLVLLKDGKKIGRQRLGAIFKSIGKVLLKTVKVIVALSPFIELALIILNYGRW